MGVFDIPLVNQRKLFRKNQLRTICSEGCIFWKETQGNPGCVKILLWWLKNRAVSMLPGFPSQPSLPGKETEVDIYRSGKYKPHWKRGNDVHIPSRLPCCHLVLKLDSSSCQSLCWHGPFQHKLLNFIFQEHLRLKYFIPQWNIWLSFVREFEIGPCFAKHDLQVLSCKTICEAIVIPNLKTQ